MSYALRGLGEQTVDCSAYFGKLALPELYKMGCVASPVETSGSGALAGGGYVGAFLEGFTFWLHPVQNIHGLMDKSPITIAGAAVPLLLAGWMLFGGRR